MFKLLQILSEIRITGNITKDMAKDLWFKVVRHPKWIGRDENYMVKYDKFLHNQAIKHNEKVRNKEIEGDHIADGVWDMINALTPGELKQWYIELKQLVNKDKLDEIKVTPKATVQKIIDLDNEFNQTEYVQNHPGVLFKSLDVYENYGYAEFYNSLDFEDWLESLSQSQLNLLYQELLKLKEL